MLPQHLHVVAAAIENDRGEYLISRRHQHAHQGGKWEFPGGKVEAGESREAALARELQEELGIVPERARPLIQVAHRYPDKAVFLDVWLVSAFRGEPHAREGQPLRWAGLSELNALEFPAANAPILAALNLPDRYLITPEPGAADDAFLRDLEQALRVNDIRLVQFRAKQMTDAAFRALARDVVAVCHARGVRVLVNSTPEDAAATGADGVHLTSRLLAEFTAPLDANMLVAASCHNPDELMQAGRIGVDFAVLGPVQATATHPGARPVGWAQFETWCREVAFPVYALGGLGAGDVLTAQRAGGQGIAAIRALWTPNKGAE